MFSNQRRLRMPHFMLCVHFIVSYFVATLLIAMFVILHILLPAPIKNATTHALEFTLRFIMFVILHILLPAPIKNAVICAL